MSEKEMRTYAVEFRAGRDEHHGPQISGRAIVYNAVTDIGGMYNEIIMPGALDETDLRDVRLLVNHDFSMIPLARSRNNTTNSTMQLMPDNEGLMIRADLDIERNADAAALYSACERGDISGMSFAFIVSVNGDEWEDLDSEKPTRRITRIDRVLEVSAVTWPAYEQTTISARDAQALESARAALESAKASAEAEARSRKRKILKILLEV